MFTTTNGVHIQERDATQPQSYDLKAMIVAYDKSASSEQALEDAVWLGRRFQAEVVLVHVSPPSGEAGMDAASLRESKRQERAKLSEDAARIASAGVHSHALLRNGAVGDLLFNICCEEMADLVLLGAYGFGAQDRNTLGSTAEHLLRSLPCPALIYGPNVTSTLASESRLGPILVPVALDCDEAELDMAASFAKLFRRPVELLHVADTPGAGHLHAAEQHCEKLARKLRLNHVTTQWSLIFGKPEQTINACSCEAASPLILMLLKDKAKRRDLQGDDIVARVIRAAKVPVLTYRSE